MLNRRGLPRPARPTAQGPVYPQGQTPPDDSNRKAESGADDREGREATLGKEQDTKDTEDILAFCQATGATSVEEVAEQSHEWPVEGASFRVRPAPRETLDGTEPFDAFILIEALRPWSATQDWKPYRAGIRVPLGALDALLPRVVRWTRRISWQGWRVRTLVLYAPHVGSRSPIVDEEGRTPPATELLRTLTALLYEEVKAKHVTWVRIHASKVDANDRLDRLHAVSTKELGSLCAGKITLEQFRRRLEFAHRRVIDAHRRNERVSQHVAQYQQDVGRELGWGDTSEDLVEDPDTALVARETEAGKERMLAALHDVLSSMGAAKRKPQRDAIEYLRKCLTNEVEPTGAGLAAFRKVDASVGWRQLHETYSQLRKELMEREKPRRKSA